MKKVLFALFPLILTACGSNPVSYLPSGTKPIVNVEANIANAVNVEASSEKLTIANQTEHAVNVVYKLFWYDVEGVTQADSNQSWQNLWLEAHQSRAIPLYKPTEESANYRIYLRGSR